MPSDAQGPTDKDPSMTYKTFHGISQLPGHKATPDMKGYDNLMGRSLDEARGGQINELLGDLRFKCTAASTRLNTIADHLERECENPDLREWEYTSYPQVCLREPFPLQSLAAVRLLGNFCSPGFPYSEQAPVGVRH